MAYIEQMTRKEAVAMAKEQIPKLIAGASIRRAGAFALAVFGVRYARTKDGASVLRVIDAAIQSLREAGKIRHTGAGWEVVDG